MPSDDVLKYLKGGAREWNAWRESNPTIQLRDWDFERLDPRGAYDGPIEFHGHDFSRLDLHGISARNIIFEGCSFDRSRLNFADLCFAYFTRCTFRGVGMRVTKIGSAKFRNCTFEHADLGYCSAEETSFVGSRIHNTSLANMSLVNVDFSEADLDAVNVYGTSAWDLKLDRTRQRDIVITQPGHATITVDNIELGQFVHLLISNSRIRDAIDTITSKVVLILGRFTPERKAVLDEIRTLLSSRNYVPVVFDFDGPQSRDLTETVRILANLSRFVIVDLTDPKSVPHELSLFVPSLPSVPVQPLIEQGQRPFAMFEHYARFPWVLTTREYQPQDIPTLTAEIVSACEERIAAR